MPFWVIFLFLLPFISFTETTLLETIEFTTSTYSFRFLTSLARLAYRRHEALKILTQLVIFKQSKSFLPPFSVRISQIDRQIDKKNDAPLYSLIEDINGLAQIKAFEYPSFSQNLHLNPSQWVCVWVNANNSKYNGILKQLLAPYTDRPNFFWHRLEHNLGLSSNYINQNICNILETEIFLNLTSNGYEGRIQEAHDVCVKLFSSWAFKKVQFYDSKFKNHMKLGPENFNKQLNFDFIELEKMISRLNGKIEISYANHVSELVEGKAFRSPKNQKSHYVIRFLGRSFGRIFGEKTPMYFTNNVEIGEHGNKNATLPINPPATYYPESNHFIFVLWRGDIAIFRNLKLPQNFTLINTLEEFQRLQEGRKKAISDEKQDGLFKLIDTFNFCMWVVFPFEALQNLKDEVRRKRLKNQFIIQADMNKIIDYFGYMLASKSGSARN